MEILRAQLLWLEGADARRVRHALLDAAPVTRCWTLRKAHDRASFTCGEPSLDDWLRKRAGQDDKRNVARVLVAVDPSQPNTALGFYSLSAFTLAPESLPNDLTRKLARYEAIPAALIGRLARAESVRGQRVGELLLADAIKRA